MLRQKTSEHCGFENGKTCRKDLCEIAPRDGVLAAGWPWGRLAQATGNEKAPATACSIRRLPAFSSQVS